MSDSAKPLALNGYGIELALKRTDYIVIDDRGAEGEGTQEELPLSDIEVDTGSDGVLGTEDLLLESKEVSDLKPLSAKELLGLGLKTGSFVMASDNQLDTLLKISEDFPKHSSSITKRNALVDFVREHSSNRQAFLPAGYNVIWLNGLQVQSRQMDAFALLEQLRRERSLVKNLQAIRLNGREAVDILSNPIIAESKVDGDAQRYDYRDAIEGGKVIVWLNDIEKDKRYSSWPSHSSAVGPLFSRGNRASSNLTVTSTNVSWPITTSSARHSQCSPTTRHIRCQRCGIARRIFADFREAKDTHSVRDSPYDLFKQCNRTSQSYLSSPGYVRSQCCLFVYGGCMLSP